MTQTGRAGAGPEDDGLEGETAGLLTSQRAEQGKGGAGYDFVVTNGAEKYGYVGEGAGSYDFVQVTMTYGCRPRMCALVVAVLLFVSGIVFTVVKMKTATLPTRAQRPVAVSIMTNESSQEVPVEEDLPLHYNCTLDSSFNVQHDGSAEDAWLPLGEIICRGLIDAAWVRVHHHYPVLTRERVGLAARRHQLSDRAAALLFAPWGASFVTQWFDHGMFVTALTGPNPAAKPMGGFIQGAWSVLDTNDDGNAEFTEIDTLMDWQPLPPEAMRVLLEADKNGDGMMDKQEFETAISSAAAPTPRGISEMIVATLASWSVAKKAWCCENAGIACESKRTKQPATVPTKPPEPSTTKAPYSCSEEIRAWSIGKKDWCCRHHHLGCLETTPAPCGCPETPAAGAVDDASVPCGVPCDAVPGDPLWMVTGGQPLSTSPRADG